MRMACFAWAAGLAMLGCSLGGCASGAAGAGDTPVLSGTNTGSTASGAYFVKWRAIPAPIPVNELFVLEVRVYADAGMTVPAEGVSIVADAGMPHHGHGMNLVPRSRAVGAGVFRVEGMLFHMPGRWELYIDVRTPDGSDRAAFEVHV